MKADMARKLITYNCWAYEQRQHETKDAQGRNRIIP